MISRFGDHQNRVRLFRIDICFAVHDYHLRPCRTVVAQEILLEPVLQGTESSSSFIVFNWEFNREFNNSSTWDVNVVDVSQLAEPY